MSENKILVRQSVPDDVPELKLLWAEVFKDGPESLSVFFELLYRPEQCVVGEVNGRLVSAGHCISGASARGLEIHYIFAMATYEQFRGLGLASKIARMLTERAFASGADVVATLPATESLTAWYSNLLDMEPAFKKGGEGVDFTAPWHEYGKLCVGHSDLTPDRLLARMKDGSSVAPLRELGWELTFD